jgi:Xaa-Pro aminopeptidase
MQGIRKYASAQYCGNFLVLFFFMAGVSFPDAPVFGQQNVYETDLLSPDFHADRRQAVREKLSPGSCAVFFSNPVRNRSNDVDYQYFQDPDLYYLSGLGEPHAALVLFSEPMVTGTDTVTEALFVQERDPLSETWNGPRMGTDSAGTRLGFRYVFLNRVFRDSIEFWIKGRKVLAKMPSDIRESGGGRTSLNSMVYHFRESVKNHETEIQGGALMKIMASLREIKQPEELALMRKAVDVTVRGLEEVIRAIEPGMTEFQAQAIVEFFFRHMGSEYPGYGSISGSGGNSCVLHYVTNRRKTRPGDLILMDMGAEYHGYTADVTRTVPVNGTFSEDQRVLYNLVLEANLAGIAACRQGNGFYDPHTAATRVIADGLVKLGIISDPSEVRKYFNHGTSHYLGMEVHDPGLYGKLAPGSIITVEPGIYIPEGAPCNRKYWNIGIRIEDDVLITDNEPVVLSGSLSKTVADIEKLMREPSLFNQLK